MTRPTRAALARAIPLFSLAGLLALPGALFSQEMPEALKENALAIRVHAIVPQGSGDRSIGADSSSPASADAGGAWQADSVKYTVPGNPAPFKLVGSNLAVIVRITPFANRSGQGLTIVAQGQVWVRLPEGGLSYHTTIDTLSVDYGESVLFFPLGLGAAGSHPLRLEITVTRAVDLPAQDAPPAKPALPAEKPAPKPSGKPGPPGP